MSKYPYYGSDTLYYAIHKKTGAMLFASSDVDKFEKIENEFKEKYPQLAKEMIVWAGYQNHINIDNSNACLDGAETYPQVLDYYHWHHHGIKPRQYIYEVEGLAYCEDATFCTYGKFSTSKKAKARATEIMKPEYQLTEIKILQILLDTDEETVVAKYETDKYGRFVKVKGD